MGSRSIAFLGFALLIACDPYADDSAGAAARKDPSSSGQDGVVELSAPPIAVIEHHNSPMRDGLYIMPSLTKARAANLKLAPDFDATYVGIVDAQPLYVPDGPGGEGAYYVTTESNDVLAIAETSGAVVWKQSFGPPADRMNAACAGAVGRLGISGTAYIDVASRTLYFDSIRASGEAGSRIIDTHLVHALSIDDGQELEGWPVDAEDAVSTGLAFDPTTTGQRGALSLVNGVLYVPYGSIADCGDYHGAVVAIDVADPSQVTAWVSPGRRAGLWSVTGIASDGEDIYFSTGNGIQDADDDWAGGSALMRLPAGPIKDAMPSDYFVPSNWRDLDIGDLDISGVVLVSQPQSTPSLLAIENGKDGNVYVLDAKNLGGSVGTKAVIQQQAGTKNFIGGTAAVPNDLGTMLIMDAQTSGKGFGCPNGQAGNIVGVQVIAGSPPTARTAWCAPNYGHGTPIITTTDGHSEAIAWVFGATGEKRLRGYDALSGDVLYDGGTDDDTVMAGLHRFSTLIATNGRLVVAADNGMYAFTF